MAQAAEVAGSCDVSNKRIAVVTIGKTSKKTMQYDQERVDSFILHAENIINSVDKGTAFRIISTEIDKCENRYLNEYITVLNYIRYEKVLDWIEENAHRISNISSNWGHLAASSCMSWLRAEAWLAKGRPLSLIALDAVAFCTTVGERRNQSLWMRQIQPRLIDCPSPDIIANRLQEYLATDRVPRTRMAIAKIIESIFDVRQ